MGVQFYRTISSGSRVGSVSENVGVSELFDPITSQPIELEAG